MTLKAISALVTVGLVMCMPVLTQQHAPLLATCEADVALWYHQDEFTDYMRAHTAFVLDKTLDKTNLNLLPVGEIIARHEEMGDCWSMTHRDVYYDADNHYMSILFDREHDFMVRHKLMNQFRAEDAEGKR